MSLNFLRKSTLQMFNVYFYATMKSRGIEVAEAFAKKKMLSIKYQNLKTKQNKNLFRNENHG